MWHAWTRARTITYSDEDPGEGSSPHSLTQRGQRSIYLSEPPAPSAPLPPHKVWDLRADNLLLHDTDHTHYWCKIYRALEVTT